MAAFLVNMFLVHIIEGNIAATKVNAEMLKEVVQTHQKRENAEKKTPQSLPL